jgi:superfamily II DNA/RNA helicase
VLPATLGTPSVVTNASAQVDAVGSFRGLRLPPAIVQALAARALTSPTAIQATSMPDALKGRDILGRARTGSGKTLAFGLPLLVRIAGRRSSPGRPAALVLVPTRELAMQVTVALSPYAGALQLRCATVVGGLSIRAQADALRRGVDVLVATPGRLADLLNRGECRLDDVAVAVVDEADQMADIGFLPQVTVLLRKVPVAAQKMLFSATLDGEVDRLVRQFLNDPATHSVDPPAVSVPTMAHHVFQVEAVDKLSTVTEIAGRRGRVIMFVDTKRGADRLTRHLLQHGVRATALHGGKSQGQRSRALEEFRGGVVNALVATNVAARGVHVDDVDLVVNVDPPVDGKRYLHRGGRTARAGRSGTVVTLVLPHQQREVSRQLATVGIKPGLATVRPGDPELVRLTGACPPSGAPVTVESGPATSRQARSARPQVSRHSRTGAQAPRNLVSRGRGRP